MVAVESVPSSFSALIVIGVKVAVTLVAVEFFSCAYFLVPVHIVMLCPAFGLLPHVCVWEIAEGTHSPPCPDMVHAVPTCTVF